jgi:SAM-dependent methyltransferase
MNRPPAPGPSGGPFPDPSLGPLADFYATPRGRMVAYLLGERLERIWPTLDGMSLLGLGYPLPYMADWSFFTQRSIVVMPPPMPPQRWPPGRPNHVCAASPGRLPFPDLIFDRVLVVHGLEGVGRARRMLREIWRVLKDDGRLLLVAPNRRGLWALVETTPFGQGQPYSSGQITRLLADTLFRIERRESALFVPPVTWPSILGSAVVWETLGRALLPPWIGGVTIAEAVKDTYAGMPVSASKRRRVLAEI